MNDVFNFRRFVTLLKRLFLERGIKLLGALIFILVICGLLLFLFASIEPGGFIGNRDVIFAMGLVLGPILYTWILANEFSNEAIGISYLTLPFSVFEKWVANVVVGYGAFTILFIGAFKVLDRWIIIFLKDKFATHPNIEVLSNRFVSLELNELFLLPVFLGWIISLCIFIGVLRFRKNALFYSLSLFFVCFLGYLFAHYGIAQVIFGGNVVYHPGSLFPYSSLVVEAQDAVLDKYKIPPLFEIQHGIYLTFVPVLIFLAWSYFVQLKEKQL